MLHQIRVSLEGFALGTDRVQTVEYHKTFSESSLGNVKVGARFIAFDGDSVKRLERLERIPHEDDVSETQQPLVGDLLLIKITRELLGYQKRFALR